MFEEGNASLEGSAPGPNMPKPPLPIPPLIPIPCPWLPPPPPPPAPPTPWQGAPPTGWLPRIALFSACIRVIYRRGGGEQGGMRGWKEGQGGLKVREWVSTKWSMTSIHNHIHSIKGHIYYLKSMRLKEVMSGRHFSSLHV